VSVSFPSTPLDATVELAIGADLTADPATWSWTDVTALVRENQKVTITRGRRNRVGNIIPTRVSATADNTDGNLCRHNPTGAHYGSLKKNTPMRVKVDNGGGDVVRAAVFVPGFPPSWDPSETDHTVTLNGVGLFDRLGRGRVLKSALYRTMTRPTAAGYTPHAYWSMEDGSTVRNFTAATADTLAAVGGLYEGSTDPVVPAGNSSIPGSSPVASLPPGAIVNYVVPSYTSTGTWAVQVAIHEDEDTTQLAFNIRSVPDNVSLTVLVYPGSSLFRTGAVNITTGASIFTTDDTITAADVSGVPASLVVGCNGDAGGTCVARLLDGDGNTIASTTTTGTGISMTPRTLSAQSVPVGGGGSVGVGHVAVFTSTSFDIATDGVEGARATGGWVGEMAHERVERLCREESVTATVTATTSQAMGPQGTSRLLDLLRECANTDVGLLHENMTFGLTYVSSSERYNLDAAITLAYGSRHILPPWEPDDDDQDFYNDITATRTDGSSYRAADEDSIDEVGEYNDPINPNVETDDQLQHVANWRLNLGLNDELTWPAVHPNLLLGGSLLNSWLAADLGDVLHVTGHPSPLAPDDIRQVIEGYTETLGSFTYTASVILSPAAPWDVGEYDDDTLGKLDTDGSELLAAVDSDDTSLTVATTTAGSPLWTTDAGETPIPLIVAGEVMSATAIRSFALDPFTRTETNSWGTEPTSGLAYTHDGTASAFNTTGTTATHTHTATNTGRLSRINIGTPDALVRSVFSVPALASGVALVAFVVGRFTDANNYLMARIGWTTGATITCTLRKRVAGVETNIQSVTISNLTHVAGTRYVVEFEYVGSALAAKLWPESGTEPQGWHAESTDSDLLTGNWAGLRSVLDTGSTNVTPFLYTFDDFTVRNPQVMTVTRSVNDVVKSQSAGAAVNVYRPARLAL
jgi:hypothetical protein